MHHVSHIQAPSYVQVSSDRQYFIQDGKYHFLLADTVWYAIPNATQKDWERYLTLRKKQGFNTLLFMALQDKRVLNQKLFPFKKNEDGSINYNELNKAYFDKAEALLDQAVKYGFTPAFAVLWSDQVQGTWTSKFDPGGIIPLPAVKKYVEYIAKHFQKYHPIYVVSGDTDFESPETKTAYLLARSIIKRYDPKAIVTFHTWGESPYLAPSLLNQLDFFSFQSGHKIYEQRNTFIYPSYFLSLKRNMPAINLEPNYEGMPYIYGWGIYSKNMRFKSKDISRATWQSLLSGAKAGIAYGAHGVWCWYKRGEPFDEKQFFGKPYDLNIAMRFKGAWDVAFAKWAFETYKLYQTYPQQDKVISTDFNVRLSATKNGDLFALYIPENEIVKIHFDLNRYEYKTEYDLHSLKAYAPKYEVKNGYSIISKLPHKKSNALLIASNHFKITNLKAFMKKLAFFQKGKARALSVSWR